ncbi:unnamed protein product, partial [Nippostrongylus brasiliensis]|uniref:Cyclic nucleotide-binding domain-containing protein n=1 Tax=Nippostrongylus brasiliensis TaxID=27835 RepID=A0A0N4XQ98_NIPBR
TLPVADNSNCRDPGLGSAASPRNRSDSRKDSSVPAVQHPTRLVVRDAEALCRIDRNGFDWVLRPVLQSV